MQITVTTDASQKIGNGLLKLYLKFQEGKINI